MNSSIILDASLELTKVMDSVVDNNLPNEIADIVKFHAKGAAIAGLGAAWVPGAGGTAALTIAAGFVWSMYLRINDKLGLSLARNLIKTVASGIATNLAAAVVGSLALTTALSIIPGLGSVGASTIMCGTCYAVTLASGFVYLKLLTKIFRAGKDPTSMTAENLKKSANEVIQSENIKAALKEAKHAFKTASDRGEFRAKAKS